MDIREPEPPPLEFVDEFLVIDPQQMEDRRIEIVDMNRVLEDVITIIIRCCWY